MDYLNGNKHLSGFYHFQPHLQGIQHAAKYKQFDAKQRALLIERILTNYQSSHINIDESQAVKNNIDKLRNENTYSVTTGHQLCIFTGPLYVVLKALHVIKLSQKLNELNDGNNYVPVFWLAGEDHDFNEIKTLQTHDQKLEWQRDAGTIPVGRLSLDGLKTLLQQLDLSKNSDIHDLIEFYTQSGNLAQATTRLLHHIFGRFGLIVINPDDKELKQTIIPIIKRDVLHSEFYTALEQTNLELGKHYKKLQITGRPINHFYITDDNQRCLIHREGDDYIIHNTNLKFSAREMDHEIVSHPERFSPNVVMRPVYQEFVLPNVAYVGGPGEVAYWLQLKLVFESASMKMPAVLLRNSFILMNYHDARELKKINIPPAEFTIGRQHEIEKSLLQKLLPLSFDIWQNQSNELFQQLYDQAVAIDNKAASDLLKDKLEWEKRWKMWYSDVNKLRKQKLDNELRMLRNLHERCYPGNVPSERKLNFTAFVTENDSIRHFVDLLYNHIEPVTSSVKIVTYL
jgi:bacillithiol biosynthesis cysteine-adding enzyme BshC